MIREARSEDCAGLAALSIQVWLDSYATDGVSPGIAAYVLHTFTEAAYKRELDEPDRRVLLSVEDGDLRGFALIDLSASFRDESNGFEVKRLYVQPRFQGQGIGRDLLHEVDVRFGKTYWLSTWVHNDRGLGFYKSLGFVDIGRIDFVLEGESHENRVLVHRGD